MEGVEWRSIGVKEHDPGLPGEVLGENAVPIQQFGFH